MQPAWTQSTACRSYSPTVLQSTYLQSHGAVLVSFDLKLPLTGPLGLPFSLQWLPCPGLLKLQLTDSLVQLTSVPGSPQPGILSSCTALTSLCLLNCSVLDLSRELGGLSVLQDLQELEVRWDATGSRRTNEAISLLPGALLSQLVRLKSVCLSETMRFASLEHLSRLTDLQRFQVVLAADNEQDRFTGISRLQRLTSLKLDCHQSQQHIGLRVKQTPDIYHLTSLQELEVVGCRVFRPGVLQQMTNLRDVILRKCAMRADDRGTSTLLRMLPLLTAVTRLDLTGTLKHPAVKLEDYKPMGKMKNLRVLVLSEGHLPAGMWQQLAAARTPMRNVWSLTINDSHLRLPTGTRLAPKFAKALDTESLFHVVKCFPCLTELSCVESTHADIEWTPLLQLTRLLSVRLSGISNADAPVLASMQRLSSLKIVGPCSITDLGLLKLTALSRLEHLDVTGNLSAALASGVTDQRSTVLSNEAPVGQVSHWLCYDAGCSFACTLLLVCMQSVNRTVTPQADLFSTMRDTKLWLSHWLDAKETARLSIGMIASAW